MTDDRETRRLVIAVVALIVFSIILGGVWPWLIR